jgi:hypothetical protein
MVTTNKIKALDFDTIEEYFEYILDSKTNGQHKQALELYKDLSPAQKKEFINWFSVFSHYDAADTGAKNPVTELLNYFEGC